MKVQIMRQALYFCQMLCCNVVFRHMHLLQCCVSTYALVIVAQVMSHPAFVEFLMTILSRPGKVIRTTVRCVHLNLMCGWTADVWPTLMPLTLTSAAGSPARLDGTAHHVHLSWSMQSSRQLAFMLMLYHCHIVYLLNKELLQLFLHPWRLCLCCCGLHSEALGIDVVIAQQSLSNDWLADCAGVASFLRGEIPEDQVQPAIASRMQQVESDLALQDAAVTAVAVFANLHPNALVGMWLGGSMML